MAKSKEGCLRPLSLWPQIQTQPVGSLQPKPTVEYDLSCGHGDVHVHGDATPCKP